MADIFKKVLGFFRYLWNSRGFSPARLLLTALYIGLILWVAPIFSTSYGHYFTQAWTIGVFAGSLALLVRSVRRIFDKKQRAAISKVMQRIGGRINERLDRLGARIIHLFGLDRMKGYGEDERDFIFRERRAGKRRRKKLVNPLFWEDQTDNPQKIRYLFTDYMIGKIKEGYRLPPSRTPRGIEDDLASTEEEQLLFNSYEAARYSGGRAPIPDSAVEILTEAADPKKAKKKG